MRACALRACALRACALRACGWRARVLDRRAGRGGALVVRQCGRRGPGSTANPRPGGAALRRRRFVKAVGSSG